MHKQPHPDTEQLDRLRSGLLDNNADARAALLEHLESCSACRDRFDSWNEVASDTLARELDPQALKADLQRARHTALAAAQPRKHMHRLVPYATAALLLVAVSVGLWTVETDTGTQTLTTAQTGEAVPDIYEDLDFYLWLANQKDNGPEEEPLNPSNT